MSYKINVQDAELKSKLGSTLTESQSVESPDIPALQRRILESTGIRVVASVNEESREIVVKRLLIG